MKKKYAERFQAPGGAFIGWFSRIFKAFLKVLGGL
jgi:hypothetical protein